MSRLFRSFSFAFFPEDPSTIGIRVTWNKHQKLVRSPHSSRTSFSHWMQKLATSLSPPQFPLQVHTELCFHYFEAYSIWQFLVGENTFWEVESLSDCRSVVDKIVKHANCQHARRCFARTSPNFKNGQAFLFARIFAGWNTDVGISHGISVNFLPVTWETSPPQKKINAGNIGLSSGLFVIWLKLRVGQWPPASCHASKKSPSRRCNGFISKKNILETTTSSADEGPSCHQSGL